MLPPSMRQNAAAAVLPDSSDSLRCCELNLLRSKGSAKGSHPLPFGLLLAGLPGDEYDGAMPGCDAEAKDTSPNATSNAPLTAIVLAKCFVEA